LKKTSHIKINKKKLSNFKMSELSNENHILELEKKFNETLSKSGNLDTIFSNEITTMSLNKDDYYLKELEQENKNLRDQNISFLEENQNLQTKLAVQALTSKKNEENINILLQENYRLKVNIEIYEQKINNKNNNPFEKNDNQIILAMNEKFKNQEREYERNLYEFKKIITQQKFQIDELKIKEENQKIIIDNNNIYNNNQYNLNIIQKDNEIKDLKNLISKYEVEINSKTQEIHKLHTTLEAQNDNLNSLIKKDDEIKDLKNLLLTYEDENNSKTQEIQKLHTALETQKDYLNSLIKKDIEIKDLNNLIFKFEQENNSKTQEIQKLQITLESQIENINILTIENTQLRTNLQKQNNNNNFLDNTKTTNHNECVKARLYQELKAKFSDLMKKNEDLKEELEEEKKKYVSLLQMNQDLGKKTIENIKVITENKSEIAYLKNKVAQLQKEKGDIFPNDFDESSNNFELNIYLEDKKKANEIKLNLEKLNQEQKVQIVELTQNIKQYEMKIQSLTDELNLEKMENENLKEIQNSDIKNISKILTEQSSQNQMKKNEEYINELKVSLQNTNKINQELAKQKTNLEKENLEMKNRIKEQQSAFFFFNNERDNINNPSIFKDDKSQAAFSKFSMASNVTQNKFFDNKIKDLEDSLIQEKENADNLLKIKQSFIDKLKKSNDNLLAEKSKLNKELTEIKMKMNSLQMEKNMLVESEDYLKSQIQDLNADLCDMKLYQENYELLEEKLEEFQKQFTQLASNYNNPQIQNEHFQKLVNENVELNAYKHKYLNIESEMQELNKELNLLKDKCFYLESENNGLKISEANLLQNIKSIQENSNNNNLNENNENNKLENNNNNISNEEKEEFEKKIKALEEEIEELKKTIEDNKLIVYSLREKCKDVIAKEKEILRLNNVIIELNQRKKKRVSFGREIVVEFKKYESADQPGNEIGSEENEVKEPKQVSTYNLVEILKNQQELYNNQFTNNDSVDQPITEIQKEENEPREPKNSSNYNLAEILKNQQELYKKYQEDLMNIKQYQHQGNFKGLDPLSDRDKIENDNHLNNNVVFICSSNNENNDKKYKHQNISKINNVNDEEFLNENCEITQIPIQLKKGAQEDQDQIHNRTNENNININMTNKINNKNQKPTMNERSSDYQNIIQDILTPLNRKNIDIGNVDTLKVLGSNLDNEFDRIKNKYNLNNFSATPTKKMFHDIDNSGVDNNVKNGDERFLGSSNPNLNRSYVKPLSIFDRILQENSINLDNNTNTTKNIDSNIYNENNNNVNTKIEDKEPNAETKVSSSAKENLGKNYSIISDNSSEVSHTEKQEVEVMEVINKENEESV